MRRFSSQFWFPSLGHNHLYYPDVCTITNISELRKLPFRCADVYIRWHHRVGCEKQFFIFFCPSTAKRFFLIKFWQHDLMYFFGVFIYYTVELCKSRKISTQSNGGHLESNLMSRQIDRIFGCTQLYWWCLLFILLCLRPYVHGAVSVYACYVPSKYDIFRMGGTERKTFRIDGAADS